MQEREDERGGEGGDDSLERSYQKGLSIKKDMLMTVCLSQFTILSRFSDRREIMQSEETLHCGEVMDRKWRRRCHDLTLLSFLATFS